MCLPLLCLILCARLVVSPQEAALWTARETSLPATRRTSRSPPPEGHCFISLHMLSAIAHVYSQLFFCARDVRGTESETEDGETDRSQVSVRQKGGEERGQVSIGEQTRCARGLAHPGERGDSRCTRRFSQADSCVTGPSHYIHSVYSRCCSDTVCWCVWTGGRECVHLVV